MLDILLDGAIAFGPERQVFYCNDEFIRIFELNRNRLFSGRPLHELVMFDDKKLFLMPEGTDGEDDVLHYRSAKFETHHGRRGIVKVAIVPTREFFAKSKLWFAYFHRESDVINQTRVQIGSLIESASSLQTKDLLQALSEIRQKLSNL